MGSGFYGLGSGFRFLGLWVQGFRVLGSGFRVLGFWVQGFRVLGFKLFRPLSSHQVLLTSQVGKIIPSLY